MPPESFDDLHRDMDRVRRKAAAFTDNLRIAGRERDPNRGGESTGSVTVTLTTDGTAPLIELAQGWRSRLRDESLGAAVITAHQSALQLQATAFLAVVEALPDSLSDHAEAATLPGDDHRSRRTTVSVNETPDGPVSVPKAIAALEETMRPLSAVVDGDSQADPDAPTVTPTAERPVVFGIGPGGIVESCLIEPRWERFYPADQVAARLNEALHRDLARGR